MGSRAFTVNYGGMCASCLERIHKGDIARYDDEGNLVHDNCDGLDDPLAVGIICGICFLQEPCEHTEEG